MPTTEDSQYGSFTTEETISDISSNDTSASVENGYPTAIIKWMLMFNTIKLVFFTISGILILTGNLLTMILVIKFKSFRSPADILVAGLASADMLRAIPLFTESFIPKIKNDILVKVATGVNLFFNGASLNVSLLDILLIAIDRYD